MGVIYNRYGVGIDMSKDSFHACISGITNQEQLKIKASRKFSNNAKGFKEFAEWVEKNRKQKDVTWRVFLEVTGVYHENLLYDLHKLGFPVCLLLGKRVKKYLQSIGFDSKNDKLDARGIAQMACEQLSRLWEPVCPEILQIRGLLRHRKAMQNVKTRFTNQLHALDHGAIDNKVKRESLEQLIKQLDSEIEAAEKEALKLAKQDPTFYKKMQMIADSVKGLGLITVLTILAETNGFTNFTSRRQLESYAGFDVIENSSGKFKGKTRISKNGNAHIRASLYMPSLSATRYLDEPFGKLYERICARNGGIKKKALVAVQRKMLGITFTLWKKNEPFCMSYYKEVEKEIRPQKLELV